MAISISLAQDTHYSFKQPSKHSEVVCTNQGSWNIFPALTVSMTLSTLLIFSLQLCREFPFPIYELCSENSSISWDMVSCWSELCASGTSCTCTCKFCKSNRQLELLFRSCLSGAKVKPAYGDHVAHVPTFCSRKLQARLPWPGSSQTTGPVRSLFGSASPRGMWEWLPAMSEMP